MRGGRSSRRRGRWGQGLVLRPGRRTRELDGWGGAGSGRPAPVRLKASTGTGSEEGPSSGSEGPGPLSTRVP